MIIFILQKKNFFPEKYPYLTIVMVTALYISLSTFEVFKKFNDQKNYEWVNFNEINIKDLLEDKKIIFVDITADWCVTCQYNEKKVINSDEIQELFTIYEVIQVQGDWTLPDENIEKFLNSYGRFGIPFNILYSNDFPEGIIMSELLTKKALKNELKKLVEKNYD